LIDPPRDATAAALADHLADFDSLTSDRLPAVSRASVAAQVRAAITNAWGWLDFAQYRPYGSEKPVPIEELRLSPATAEVFAPLGAGELSRATIGVLATLDGFGPIPLLDYLASMEAAYERGVLDEGQFDVGHSFLEPQQKPRSIAPPSRVEPSLALDSITPRSARGSEQRLQRIIDLRREGWMLEQIGLKVGLTRERVRQLIKDAGYDSKELAREGREAKRSEEENLFQEMLRENEQEIRELIEDGRGVRDIAATLDVPVKVLDQFIRALPDYDDLRWILGNLKKTGTRNYTDTELIECLRTAARELGGVLAAYTYTDFARGRSFEDGRPWPTHQTMALRFGTWRDAVVAAGLPANERSPIYGRHVFTDEHCIDAILEVERALGKVPTNLEYEAYAREQNGAIPSGATVRHRLGGWSGALRRVGEFQRGET
jgi:hypothetical protein